MSTSQNSPYPELPDDTLLEIFHHFLGQPDDDIQDSDTWIPVTLSHVCSNWRCLTLASPLLWTNIYLTSFPNPDILRQYLTRSRDALLRINIAPPVISNVNLLAQTLASQSHRFVSFHLRGINGDTLIEVLSFFTSPAPQLRSLHIHPGSTEVSLDTVFGDQMPLLSDMEITADYSDMLARRNLTRLSICAEFVKADELVNLLCGCPTLESLHLWDLSHPDAAFRRLERIPVIPLKCLRELSVYESCLEDMAILPYLSFPKTTIVRLHYFRPSEPVTVLRDCASLREIASDVTMATLELWVDLPHTFVALRSPQLEIEVYGYNGDLEEYEFFGFFSFFAMPFPALSHLTIRNLDCLHILPEDQWCRMFQVIQTITHLEVCAKDATTLAVLRVIKMGSPDADRVLCPELTHLVLSEGIGEGQVICEEMLSCCLARAAAGAPIISCEIVLATGQEISTPVLARLNEVGIQITNSPNSDEAIATQSADSM